jgi:hypothetical protein
MKALISDCGNNTYVIRNSKGKTWHLIGSHDGSCWNWSTNYLMDMSINPNYHLPGKLLHEIPDHIKKEYFKLMKL